ncbi:MAG: hypothetical protein WCF23_04355 [Candidatus Nitrosopolaris sp.]
MELLQAEVINQKEGAMKDYKRKDVPRALFEVQKGCRSNPVNRRNDQKVHS